MVKTLRVNTLSSSKSTFFITNTFIVHIYLHIAYVYIHIYSLTVPEENVATPKHGANVVSGEVKSALLDGDSSNYDMERGFTRHPIDDNSDKGIVIKLGMQCIINHFRMLLWDKDNRYICGLE